VLRYGVTCIACAVLVLLALRDGGPGSSPAVPGPVELATESRAPAIVQSRTARARDREVTPRRSSPRRPRVTRQTHRRPVRRTAASLTAGRRGSLPDPTVRDGSPAAGDGETGSRGSGGGRPRRPGGGGRPSPDVPSAPADTRTDVPAAGPAPAPASAPVAPPLQEADDIEAPDDVESPDDDDPAELAEEADDGD